MSLHVCVSSISLAQGKRLLAGYNRRGAVSEELGLMHQVGAAESAFTLVGKTEDHMFSLKQVNFDTRIKEIEGYVKESATNFVKVETDAAGFFKWPAVAALGICSYTAVAYMHQPKKAVAVLCLWTKLCDSYCPKAKRARFQPSIPSFAAVPGDIEVAAFTVRYKKTAYSDPFFALATKESEMKLVAICEGFIAMSKKAEDENIDCHPSGEDALKSVLHGYKVVASIVSPEPFVHGLTHHDVEVFLCSADANSDKQDILLKQWLNSNKFMKGKVRAFLDAKMKEVLWKPLMDQHISDIENSGTSRIERALEELPKIIKELRPDGCCKLVAVVQASLKTMAEGALQKRSLEELSKTLDLGRSCRMAIGTLAADIEKVMKSVSDLEMLVKDEKRNEIVHEAIAAYDTDSTEETLKVLSKAAKEGQGGKIDAEKVSAAIAKVGKQLQAKYTEEDMYKQIDDIDTHTETRKSLRKLLKSRDEDKNAIDFFEKYLPEACRHRNLLGNLQTEIAKKNMKDDKELLLGFDALRYATIRMKKEEALWTTKKAEAEKKAEELSTGGFTAELFTGPDKEFIERAAAVLKVTEADMKSAVENAVDELCKSMDNAVTKATPLMKGGLHGEPWHADLDEDAAAAKVKEKLKAFNSVLMAEADGGSGIGESYQELQKLAEKAASYKIKFNGTEIPSEKNETLEKAVKSAQACQETCERTVKEGVISELLLNEELGKTQKKKKLVSKETKMKEVFDDLPVAVKRQADLAMGK